MQSLICQKQIQFVKKFGLRLTGRWKCYFSIFAFSLFLILKWLFLLSVINIFDLHIFDSETATLLNFFEICPEMHFVSLFFLNERNITASLLVIHLKCTVVHYANLNWRSINKPFLNYGPLNMLFRFFRFLIYVYFNEAFVKKLLK